MFSGKFTNVRANIGKAACGYAASGVGPNDSKLDSAYSITETVTSFGSDFCIGRDKSGNEILALVWVCDSTDIPNFTRNK